MPEIEIEKAAEVLTRVSSFLRTLTDEQVDDLIAGKVRLALTQNSERRRASKRGSAAKIDVAHIREELMNRKTREEGIDFLNELALPRNSLQEIAAAMDLPTPRSDTVERLKDRIIEATIGYRLRSNAIRSTDLPLDPFLRQIGPWLSFRVRVLFGFGLVEVGGGLHLGLVPARVRSAP